MSEFFETFKTLYRLFISGWYIYGLVIFILCFFLLFLIRKLRKRRQPIIAFDSGRGKVMILPQAIIELVQRTSIAIEGINKCRCFLDISRGRMKRINIKIQLLAQCRIPKVHADLEGRLRDTLSQSMGMDDPGKINIIVDSIVGAPPVNEASPEEELIRLTPPSHQKEIAQASTLDDYPDEALMADYEEESKK